MRVKCVQGWLNKAVTTIANWQWMVNFSNLEQVEQKVQDEVDQWFTDYSVAFLFDMVNQCRIASVKTIIKKPNK